MLWLLFSVCYCVDSTWVGGFVDYCNCLLWGFVIVFHVVLFCGYVITLVAIIGVM